MAQSPGDDRTEPSLELPSLKLPGLGRRRRKTEEAAGTTHAPVEDPRPADEPTQELAPAAPAPAPERPREPWDQHATQTLPLNGNGAHPRPPAAPEDEDRPGRDKAEPRGPVVPGWVAAGVTGVLVGAAGAAGTYLAMAGCEAVRGVSTCGGAPGFLILLAIVVLMVLLGAGLLKAFRLDATGSTSFLAVGIVTVLVMLLLLDVIFSAWMFAVIPALTAAAFLLAHWVTTRFDGEDTGRRDWR